MTAEEKPFFFLHVMKTGGTTFISQVQENFPAEEQYPVPGLEHRKRVSAYMFTKPVQDLTEEQKDRIRLYCGHLPFMATEMVGRPVTVLTLLRDPVERTISHLRHIQRGPIVAGLVPAQKYTTMGLEEIYDDEDRFTRFLHNFQVKMFAMTPEDGVGSSAAPLDVDDAHLAIAKANLDKVDVLGLNAHFNEFTAEVRRRFGWNVTDGPRMQVSSGEVDISPEFRARIAADNQADLEFYRYAVDLYERRKAGS